MGSICMAAKVGKVVYVESGEEKTTLEEVEKVLVSDFLESGFEDANIKQCQEELKEIEMIGITYMLKELNEQKQFLKLQLWKPICELAEFRAGDIMQLLRMYRHFLEQVQEHRPKKLMAWWSAEKKVISVEEAINYWNQQIIRMAGRLRYQLALRRVEIQPPTPERFQKTREWIRKNNQESDVGEEGEEDGEIAHKLK